MSAEGNVLGIFVTSPQYMRHVVGITQAALRAGKKVKVFFSFKAVHLTKHPDFVKLANLLPLDDLSICAASYNCEGFDPQLDIPKGLTAAQMRTQAAHGEIIEECDRYLVF